MRKLFVFEHKELVEDLIDPKTKKVVKHQSMVIIAQSEQEARNIDKNLDTNYSLVSIKDLSKHWN